MQAAEFEITTVYHHHRRRQGQAPCWSTAAFTVCCHCSRSCTCLNGVCVYCVNLHMYTPYVYVWSVNVFSRSDQPSQRTVSGVSFLHSYMSIVCHSATEILQQAAALVVRDYRQFEAVSKVVDSEITGLCHYILSRCFCPASGFNSFHYQWLCECPQCILPWNYRRRIYVDMFVGVLLPELLTCLVIVEKKMPELLHRLNVVPTLHALLDALDAFNRCAPGSLRDDADDLSFPSLQGLSP